MAPLSSGDGGSVLVFPVRAPSFELPSLSIFGLNLSVKDPKRCSMEPQVPNPSWCFLRRLRKEDGLNQQRCVRVNEDPRTAPTNTTRRNDGPVLSPNARWVSLLSRQFILQFPCSPTPPLLLCKRRLPLKPPFPSVGFGAWGRMDLSVNCSGFEIFFVDLLESLIYLIRFDSMVLDIFLAESLMIRPPSTVDEESASGWSSRKG